MNTTFVNQNEEGTIIEEGKKYFNLRWPNLNYFMEVGTEGDENELREACNSGKYSFAELREFVKTYYDGIGAFNEYGLCFDYVELGTFNDQENDYFRYQFSYGGPSDELRFYEDGTIVYVYLNWFCGVGFDVSDDEVCQWVKDWFDSCDMMNFAEKREEYDYYEQLDRIENPEEYAETDEEDE